MPTLTTLGSVPGSGTTEIKIVNSGTLPGEAGQVLSDNFSAIYDSLTLGGTGGYLPLDGGTMSGAISLDANQINYDSAAYVSADGSGNVSSWVNAEQWNTPNYNPTTSSGGNPYGTYGFGGITDGLAWLGDRSGANNGTYISIDDTSAAISLYGTTNISGTLTLSGSTLDLTGATVTNLSTSGGSVWTLGDASAANAVTPAVVNVTIGGVSYALAQANSSPAVAWTNNSGNNAHITGGSISLTYAINMTTYKKMMFYLDGLTTDSTGLVGIYLPFTVVPSVTNGTGAVISSLTAGSFTLKNTGAGTTGFIFFEGY